MPAIQPLMRSLQKDSDGKEKEVYSGMENKVGGTTDQLRSALKVGDFKKKKDSLY